ncbi:MAG: recombination protein NinB [Janthinobacterium lividum]
MSEAVLYKEFRLSRASVWTAVVAFIKANAKAFADRGEPLRIIVTAEEKQRNAQQNKLYWGGVLRYIAEQAWVDGRQFSADTWHEHYARMYGECEDVTLPDGEIIVRRKSTTKMTVGEFSGYIDRVRAHAAMNLGVEFDS